jgi:hypothetical protein
VAEGIAVAVVRGLRASALKERRKSARCPSPPVTWACTHILVTCKQRDNGFTIEKQKRDATDLLCTDIPSLRAFVQLRELRTRSVCGASSFHVR